MTLVERVTEAFGPVERISAVGGGLVRFEVAGRELVAKSDPGVTDEADGLMALAAVGGPAVPAVVLSRPDLLVTTWVDQGPRTPGHEEELGRSVARLHQVAAPAWGGGSSWIGACPVGPAEHPDAATFYGTRLVALGSRCGLADPAAKVASPPSRTTPAGWPRPPAR